MRVMTGRTPDALREIRMRPGQRPRIGRIQRASVFIETKRRNDRQHKHRHQHA